MLDILNFYGMSLAFYFYQTKPKSIMKIFISPSISFYFPKTLKILKMQLCYGDYLVKWNISAK